MVMVIAWKGPRSFQSVPTSNARYHDAEVNSSWQCSWRILQLTLDCKGRAVGTLSTTYVLAPSLTN